MDTLKIGQYIQHLRKAAGMTQKDLAEKLNISFQAVSKWENAIAMPDITLLPKIAEIFGVSIDELFDLTVEQKLNRIENRMDFEEELPHDVFWEYEEFLKAQLADEHYKLRATSLLAYLYDHNMRAYAAKARKYAKESIRLQPDKKDCQWILNMAEGHFVWDWNLSNMTMFSCHTCNEQTSLLSIINRMRKQTGNLLWSMESSTMRSNGIIPTPLTLAKQ